MKTLLLSIKKTMSALHLKVMGNENLFASEVSCKKSNSTILGRFGTLATMAAAVLLTTLAPQAAFGWDSANRDTRYQADENPTLYLGDTYVLSWDIGAGYAVAQYGIGTVNTAAGLTWNNVTFLNKDGGSANSCSGNEVYTNSIQVTSLGAWYYSLYVGYAADGTGSSCDNGVYYIGNSSCNNGASGNVCQFASDTITVNALAAPASPTATRSDTALSVSLTWSASTSGNGVKSTLILRNTSNSFTDPTGGTSYSIGSTIGSATVVYNGSGGSATDTTSLAGGQVYYYKFYAVNNNYYSPGATTIPSTTTRPTTVTWNGGGADNNLQTDANWASPNLYPLTSSSTVLNFAGSTQTSPNNNYTAGSTFGSIFFNSGASAFTLGGNAFNIQNKIENDSSSLATITAPVTFAATSGATFGEINAVSGNLTFSTGTLTVNGSSINGIKMWGTTGNTLTLNSTVSASGKWFGLTQNPAGSVTIGGSFTSGDFYVMNGGTLNLASGGSFSTTALRLGGDYGTTGNQNQTNGAAFVLTSPTGGQTFSGIINSVAGNTSGALVIGAANTSGTTTLTGASYLDSGLIVTNAAGGTMLFNPSATTAFDVKAQQLTFTPKGIITVQGILTSSLTTGGGGNVVMNGSGTLILQSTANNYTGTSSSSLNANGTQISGGGVLGIYGDGSLGVAPAGPYNNIQFTGSGTLQDTANNITLNANRNISIAASQTATFDSDGNTFTIAGNINGSGAVAKIGSGTLALTGASTYAGNTTINAGTLLANNTTGSGTGTGTVTINSSATLGGTGIVSGTVTVNSGGTIAPGNNGIGTLTLGATPSLGGTVAMEIGKTSGATSSDLLTNSGGGFTYGGTLTVTKTGSDTLAAGDSFTLFAKNSGSFSGGFGSVTVPTLASGISWDTNKLATTGVLDIYTFATMPLSLFTPVNSNAVISVGKLANHASSSRGTPQATVVTSSASHGTATVSSGVLTYAPNASYSGSDSFTLTYQDGHGWQTMAVSVTVGTSNAGGQSPNLLASGMDANHQFYALFAGLPNTQFTVETNGSLNTPNWQKYANSTTSATGLLSVTNIITSASPLYFRTVYPSY